MESLIITYATRPFAIRVAKSLQQKFSLLAATSDEIPAPMADQYIKIPRGVNPTFAHELLKIALDKGCKYILPMGLDEIQSLSESIILFEEYGIKVLCPNHIDLATLECLANPHKDLALSLLIDQYDVLQDEQRPFGFNGLGIVSDSGEEFIVAIVK